MTTRAPRYQFRNHTAQLHPLQDVLDPITREELRRIGITAGQHALDVGAGAGSIAAHLCDLVGPTGKVTAVDIDTSLLDPTGILDVYQRDLRTQPLPVNTDSVDVAVARCILEHLSNRRALLRQMIATLRPGGWLVLGEIVYAPVVAHAPRTADSDLIAHVVHGILDVLSANDVDLHWGDKTHAVLSASGLEEVRTRWTAETWAGGSPGCRLLADNAHQLHHKLLHEGLTHTDLDHFAELMIDPAVLVRGYLFASSTARKPTAAALTGQPPGQPRDHGTTAIGPPSPQPNLPAGNSLPGTLYTHGIHRERRLPDNAGPAGLTGRTVRRSVSAAARTSGRSGSRVRPTWLSPGCHRGLVSCVNGVPARDGIVDGALRRLRAVPARDDLDCGLRGRLIHVVCE